MSSPGSVHVVVDVQVLDHDLFTEYAQGHVASLEAYGGRILFRSLNLEPVTGDWRPRCLVVHEWPSAQAFWSWWRSEDYRPWAEMRDKAASVNMVIAHEGF
jgi:uncharacterized protein (DUF1330 family)